MKKFVYLVIFIFSWVFFSSSTMASYIMWTDTTIYIDVFDSVNDYLDLPQAHYVKNGVIDDSITFTYLKNGVNATFQSSVITSVVDSYIIYYKAKASTGLTSTAQITFIVQDRIPPEITLSKEEIKIPLGLETYDYTILSTLKDNYDATSCLSLKIDSSQVIYQKVGVYEVLFLASDSSNNLSSKALRVLVYDQEKPVITYNGPSEVDINDSKFDVLDFLSAIDNYDGDITNRIKVDFDYSIREIGPLSIMASVSDQSGNKETIMVNILVKDNDPPKIFLREYELDLDIEKNYDWDFFFKQIKSVSDNYEFIPKENVEIDLSFLEAEIGDYEVCYSISDESGNIGYSYMEVHLRETTPPEVKVNDIELRINQEFDLTDYLVIYDKYDNEVAKTLTITSSNLDLTKAGIYHINFYVYNSSGLFTEEIATIYVMEEEKPKEDIDSPVEITPEKEEENQLEGFLKDYLIWIFLFICGLGYLLKKYIQKEK